MNIKSFNHSTRSGLLAWLAQTRSTVALCAMSGAMLAAAGLLALTTSARAGDSDCPDSAVFPPYSHPYGASYGEWLARFWKFTYAFPSTADPDLGTADWSANQHGEVWFLPVTFVSGSVTLTGTIPAETALFGPVFSYEMDNSDCPTYNDYTLDQLEGILQGFWSAVTETSCTIDGVAVKGMDNSQATPYLVWTPPFSYTLASHDNLDAYFGYTCIPDGTTVYPAVACGVCVMIAPLPVGHHTIQFYVDDAGTVWTVTYEITVVRRCDHGDK